MSRRFILGIVTLAAFAVIAGGVFIAAGNPNNPTAADESAKIENEVTVLSELQLSPEEAAQLPLVEAKRKIEKLWKELGLPGYPAGRFENDESMSLFYRGELPPEVSALIEQLRSDVQIDVVNSPYSLTELMAEAKRLVELDSTEAGVTITEAGPLPDFSGIRVTIESPGRQLDAQQLELASRVIQSPVRLEFAVSPKNEPSLYGDSEIDLR